MAWRGVAWLWRYPGTCPGVASRVTATQQSSEKSSDDNGKGKKRKQKQQDGWTHKCACVVGTETEDWGIKTTLGDAGSLQMRVLPPWVFFSGASILFPRGPGPFKGPVAFFLPCLFVLSGALWSVQSGTLARLHLPAWADAGTAKPTRAEQPHSPGRPSSQPASRLVSCLPASHSHPHPPIHQSPPPIQPQKSPLPYIAYQERHSSAHYWPSLPH